MFQSGYWSRVHLRIARSACARPRQAAPAARRPGRRNSSCREGTPREETADGSWQTRRSYIASAPDELDRRRAPPLRAEAAHELPGSRGRILLRVRPLDRLVDPCAPDRDGPDADVAPADLDRPQ